MPEAYVLNPIQHNQGGRDNPYEKYHLTHAEWAVATRDASLVQDGLAPAGVLSFMDYVEPPIESDSPGEEGMRALDANYFYLCIALNTWRRIPIGSF